jgi:hypothetical protein
MSKIFHCLNAQFKRLAIATVPNAQGSTLFERLALLADAQLMTARVSSPADVICA